VFVLRMPTLPSRPCVFQRDLIDTTPPTREIRAYCVASSLVAARAFPTWMSTAELGSLVAGLGGLDALVFSAGIGEHDALTRVEVVDGSRWTGALLDPARNAQSEGLISVEDSSVAVWVIPTDEERLIARHTAAMLQ
jgi:acetate kinase